MEKLRVLAIIISIFSLWSCMDNPFSPEESSSPVKALVYTDAGSVVKFDVATGRKSVLYTPDEGSELGGVAVDKDAKVYVSVYESYSGMFINTVCRINPDGSKETVFKDEVPVKFNYTSLFSSPSGKYILLHSRVYSDYELLCIEVANNTNEVRFTSYDRGPMLIKVDLSRLVWDETNYRFYTQNAYLGDPRIVGYDLVTGAIDSKTSPYIQLYVEEEVLVSQGIIQDQFDFEKYLGPDYSVPSVSRFHPNSNAFLFVDEYKLKCYNLDNETLSTLMSVPKSTMQEEFFTDLEIIWDTEIAPKDIQADLDGEFRYIVLTDSILQTKQPLNSNVRYDLVDFYSLPLLKAEWGDYSSEVTEEFLIKGELFDSKFHAAESYLVFSTLYKHFYSDAGASINKVRAKFTTMDEAVTEYQGLIDYRELNYSVLKNAEVTDFFKSDKADLLAITDRLLALEKATLDYLHDRDRAKLFETSKNLFPEVSESYISARLTDLAYGENRMLSALAGLISGIGYNMSDPVYFIQASVDRTLENYNVFLK